MSGREVGRRFVSSTGVLGRRVALGRAAYLHDKLDGADEVAQELENQVLLLLLHLIETILPSPLENLLACETSASVGLELVLRDHTTGTRGRAFFLFLLLIDALVCDSFGSDAERVTPMCKGRRDAKT